MPAAPHLPHPYLPPQPPQHGLLTSTAAIPVIYATLPILAAPQLTTQPHAPHQTVLPVSQASFPPAEPQPPGTQQAAGLQSADASMTVKHLADASTQTDQPAQHCAPDFAEIAYTADEPPGAQSHQHAQLTMPTPGYSASCSFNCSV